MRLSLAADDRLFPALMLAAAIHGLLGWFVRFDPQEPVDAPTVIDVLIEADSGANAGEPAAPTDRTDPEPRAVGLDGPARSPAPAPPEPVSTEVASASVEPAMASGPAPRPERVEAERREPADPAAAESDDAAAGQPAHVSAETLARQITEWTEGYTQAQRTGTGTAARSARIEQVTGKRHLANAYEQAWQDKVERVGNMNYPEEARRKNLTGSLSLSVAVGADGGIQSIRVRQSSGHEELDQAAARIVRLAAPFGAFPSELKKDYDVLVITRTWRFMTDHRLSTAP